MIVFLNRTFGFFINRGVLEECAERPQWNLLWKKDLALCAHFKRQEIGVSQEGNRQRLSYKVRIVTGRF